jgi:hypothetical protein
MDESSEQDDQIVEVPMSNLTPEEFASRVWIGKEGTIGCIPAQVVGIDRQKQTVRFLKRPLPHQKP